MNQDSLDCYDKVRAFLISLGWRVLEKPKIQDNYFDITAISNKKSLRIEIKNLNKKANGTWQVSAISEKQKNSDAVAVVFPNGGVFIERTEDYIKHCAAGGTRQFTWIKP